MENDIHEERRRRMEYISTLLTNNDLHNANDSNQRVFVMKSPMKVPGGERSSDNIHNISSAAIQADGKILVSNKYSRAKSIAERIESKYLKKVFHFWRGIYVAHNFNRTNLFAKVLRRWKRFHARKHEQDKNIRIQGNHIESISRPLLLKQSSSKSQLPQRVPPSRQLPNVLIVESMSIPSAPIIYRTNSNSSIRKATLLNSMSHKNSRTPVRVRNKSLFVPDESKRQQTPLLHSKAKKAIPVNNAATVLQINPEVNQEVEPALPVPSQHSPSVPPRPTNTIEDVLIARNPVNTKQQKQPAQEEEVVSSLSSLSVVETAQRKDQLAQQQTQQQAPRHVSKLSRITADHQQQNRHHSAVPPRSDSPLMQAVQASNRLNQVINFLREKEERKQQSQQPQQQQSPRKYNPLQQAPHSVPTSHRYDQTVDESEEELANDYGSEDLMPNISMPLPLEEEITGEDDDEEGSQKHDESPPPPPPLIIHSAPIIPQAAANIFFLTSPLLDDVNNEGETEAGPQSQEEKQIPTFSPAKTITTGLHSNDQSPLRSSSMSQEQVDNRLDLYRKRRFFGVLKRQLLALEQRWEERQALHKYYKACLKQTYLHRWRLFKQRQQLRRDQSLNRSYPLYPAALTLSQGSGQHFISQYSLRIAWSKFLQFTKVAKQRRLDSLRTDLFHIRKVMRAALYEWRIFYVLSRKKNVIAQRPVAPPPLVVSSRLTSPEAIKTDITDAASLIPSPSHTSPVHQTSMITIERRRSMPDPPPPLPPAASQAQQPIEAVEAVTVTPSIGEPSEEHLLPEHLPPLPPPQQQQIGEEAPVAIESDDTKASTLEESSEDTTIIPNFRSDPVYLPPLPLPPPITAMQQTNDDEGAYQMQQQHQFTPVGILPVTLLQEAYAAWIEEEESDDSHDEYEDEYTDHYDYDGDNGDDNVDDEDDNFYEYEAVEAVPPSSSPALFLAHDTSDEDQDESDYEDYETNDHHIQNTTTTSELQPHHEIVQEEQQQVFEPEMEKDAKPVITISKPKMSVDTALRCMHALVILWRGHRLHRRKLLKQGLFYLIKHTLCKYARHNEHMLLRNWHKIQILKQVFVAWKKTVTLS